MLISILNTLTSLGMMKRCLIYSIKMRMAMMKIRINPNNTVYLTRRMSSMMLRYMRKRRRNHQPTGHGSTCSKDQLMIKWLNLSRINKWTYKRLKSMIFQIE